MGDVADILGLALGPSKRKTQKKAQKPKGMSREVFSLIGTNKNSAQYQDLVATSLPPVAPSSLKSKNLKEKIAILKQRKAKPWKWTLFTNSARSDSMQLGHWQKKDQVLADYAFSRFNRQCVVVSYVDDAEYNAIPPQRPPPSPLWTKSETDSLLYLCERFSLRWPVISDRLSFKSSIPRSMPDIKARYYHVAKCVLQNRRRPPLAPPTAPVIQPPAPAPSAFQTLPQLTPPGTTTPTPVQPLVVKSTDTTGAPVTAKPLEAKTSVNNPPASVLPGSATTSSAAAPTITGEAMEIEKQDAKETRPALRTKGTVTSKARTKVENALLEFNFDIENEQKRLSQLTYQHSRSNADEREETKMLMEIRKLDLQIRKLQKEKKSKKWPLSSQKNADQTQANQPTLVEKDIAKVEIERKTRKTHARMRSAELNTTPTSLGVGRRMLKKVHSTLTELGVPERPLATAQVFDAHDKLRQDIVKLLGLKTFLQKKKLELLKLKGLPIPVKQTGQKARSDKGRKRKASSSLSTHRKSSKKQSTATSAAATTALMPPPSGSGSSARSSGRMKKKKVAK